MQKIGNTTNTADKDGEFTDGDPQKQIPPTRLMAAWLNTLQRELIKVVRAGGLTLDPKDDTQLYKAIEKLIGDAETDLKSKTLRQIPLQSGSATHWLKIATMPPVVNSETRLEIELSGMSDYGVNATGMAVDRVYLTTRGTSASTRVTAATVGNLIQQFSLGRSVDTQNYLVGVTEEVSNGNTTQYNFWLKMSNHTGISSTMNILNSRYSGVTIISDFSGANNSATEPAGIVYATRQQFFTTANPQQVADATTTAKGIVQLSSATNSASETLAATPKAVKATHDLAAAALPLTGGTVTGPTTFGGQLTVTNADFINKVGYTTYKDGDGHDHHQVGGLRLEVDGSQMAELYYNVLAGQSAEVSLHNKYGTTDSYLSLRNDGQLTIVGSNPQLYLGNSIVGNDGNVFGAAYGNDWLTNWVKSYTFNGNNHPTQSSVSGNQWWYKDLSTGMIFQGGYTEGQNADARDRIALNISVPNRLLYVSTIIKNYAQGYNTTYNPQVGDLTSERDGFWWFHGAQERVIYWMAVGY